MSELLFTELHQWHVDNGGRMVPFAGYELPVQYPSGPVLEHNTTRTSAGLFDIDHMGQVEVVGKDAEKFVDHMVSYDVKTMALNDAHYSLMCYADGTVVDDIFIYKLPHAEFGFYFFIAINAANRKKDVQWITSHASGFDVQIKDLSDDMYMIAFQGPKAPEIMDRLTKADLTQMPRFTALQEVIFGDVNVILGRTGYTGEDGFELYVANKYAVKVWEGILEEGKAEGVLPIGLAARDSLRFEACMPLYGHELSDSITPFEAGLNFAVSYNKEFIGKDALQKQRLEKSGRALVGFEMVGKGVAREHYAVQVNGVEVGVVSSGMFAPTLKKYLGMAFVSREFMKAGTELDIMIRDKAVKAVVVKKPFYVPAYRK